MKQLRWIAFLLVILLVLSLATSCAKEGQVLFGPSFKLDEKEIANIVLVHGEYEKKSNPVKKGVEALQTAFETKWGSTIEEKQDTEVSADENRKEILIGTTNRVESDCSSEYLRKNDFIIKVENNRLVLLGGSQEATQSAIDYFIEKYLSDDSKRVKLKTNLKELVRYDYKLGKQFIDGVPLSSYQVVYPKDCDLLTYNSALCLADYIKSNAEIELAVVADDAQPTTYEFLVGNTSRTESSSISKETYKSGEFLLAKVGTKIVLQGEGYLCAGAAGKLVNTYLGTQANKDDVNATNLPTAENAKGEVPVFTDPKNVILMIGDGMGRNHVLSALSASTISSWIGDSFPSQAYCTTYSDSVIKKNAAATDSAASATALATGVKTTNGYVGVNPQNETLENVREKAHNIGCQTAILTTDVITGATPSAFLVHINNRDSTSNIQYQIRSLVTNKKVTVCEGSLDDTLPQSTREALCKISKNGSRFFTMIEEAYTDKGSHSNDMDVVTKAVKRLNESVAYAVAFTMLHPDTALILTADHETGGITMSESGYQFTQTSHSNQSVPVYAIGAGVQNLVGSGNIDNTDIAKFMIAIYQ